jgi:hypothetical protein
MKRAFVGFTVCLAFGIAGVAPSHAGTVYVPVLDPNGAGGGVHSTVISISNSATAQKSYSTVFLESEKDGTKRAVNPSQGSVFAGRTVLLNNFAAAGKFGLLEIDAPADLSIEARLTSMPSGGGNPASAIVPIITSDNLVAAGQTAHVLGLRRDSSRGDFSGLGVVNLSQQQAQCTVKFFRADSTPIGSTASLGFLPLSLRHFPDALGLLGEAKVSDVRAQVSCNQPFFVYGTVFAQTNGQMLFVPPAATGASTLARPGSGGGTTNPPPASGAVVFTANGLLHTATRSKPKGTVDIVLDRPLTVRKMVIDLDFVPGPWNRLKIPGNHAILYLHRGSFRSNTICNVNAFGPDKYSVKMNQNVNLGPGSVTNAEGGISLEQGKTYHMRYVYDAQARKATVTISAGGQTLKTLSMDILPSVLNGVLDLPARGMRAEFGHYDHQEGPELASYGWSYMNLRVEMIP